MILRATNVDNQLYLEHDTYIDLGGEDNIIPEVDNSLFRQYINSDVDLYDQIHRYLYSPISIKWRGVEWWNKDRITPNHSPFKDNIAQPINLSEIKLFTTTSGYRVGGSARWSRVLSGGWGITSSIYLRTGRDANIEGVFRNDISPKVTATKDFGDAHLLTMTLDVPYQMRGLRSSATQECYDLTHNNLYNPSWGFYKGEVRNSRVVRNFLPSLTAHYQRPISTSTLIHADIDLDYGTRKTSRLGWYNSSNPSPNYYSKLPSYYLGSSPYEEVYNVWQQNNSDYTQIGWDRLEDLNRSSTDGASYYVVEDRVERVADIDMNILFITALNNSLKIEYGGGVNIYNHRNYKQMRDLLGGEYLLDIDQYAGDYVQVGSELQNNLRDPNRKITVGDRFGYDYTHHRTHIEATSRLRYNSKLVDAQLCIAIGDESIYRQGHYEKERFAGSGSYGDSQKIALSTYNISMSGGYALAPQHYISVEVNLNTEAPMSRYMFIADQNSNRVIDSPKTNKITSASLKYRHVTSDVSLSVEGYIVSTRDQGEVWQGYDDLSSTYCDIVISDIATRSLGVEICGEINIQRRLKLTSSISAGGFAYTSAPFVQLYDDVDMSVVAESHASAISGCVVGNTPQISATAGMTYFGSKNLIVDIDLAYYALRYSAPSIVRRTDRVLNSATSTEALESMLHQERLPNLFNANLTIAKSFPLKNNDAISVVARIDNLLGARDIIYSAREGNRVLSSYDSGVTYGYSPQASTYQYSTGRVFYLSLKYKF